MQIVDLAVWWADEVESLTAARAGAMSGTEPSDALRVSFASDLFDLNMQR
jgi:hypothetical protein